MHQRRRFAAILVAVPLAARRPAAPVGSTPNRSASAADEHASSSSSAPHDAEEPGDVGALPSPTDEEPPGDAIFPADTSDDGGPAQAGSAPDPSGQGGGVGLRLATPRAGSTGW